MEFTDEQLVFAEQVEFAEEVEFEKFRETYLRNLDRALEQHPGRAIEVALEWTREELKKKS